MTHLIRAGIVLGAILIAAFIVPRIIPVPENLQKFGFDKVNAQENNEYWATRPLQYANLQVCNDCHAANYTTWQLGDHNTVSCESCHAPAYDHVTGGEPPEIDRTPELCTNCHGQTVSRPPDFPQVDPAAHSGGLVCLTCHNPHEPRQYIAPLMPHAIEGRENCAACHLPNQPIDMPPPLVIHSLEGRENCVECHAPGLVTSAVTGAPLIPHPLEGRENCLLCHGAKTLVEFPTDHEGRTTDTCRLCHQTQDEAKPVQPTASEPAGPEATTEPAATATPTATVAAGPPNVPHALDGRDNCLLCHDTSGLKPFPADHAGRSTELCLVCHKAS